MLFVTFIITDKEVNKLLPLSWTSKQIDAPKFNWVNLPLSGIAWVYGAEIPYDYSLDDICGDLESEFADGYLLRGCRGEIASFLMKKGYQIIRTGAEGTINLDNLCEIPKSVTSLAIRGGRIGEVEEISLTAGNQIGVSKFIGHTPHGSKPHLKYLFNNTFDPNTRCFVMKSLDDSWLGVITISYTAQHWCHTEMILRHRHASVGVMEYLFLSVMNILKAEGNRMFSLGEVPFITPDSMEDNNLKPTVKRSIQESLLFRSGHILRYAFNYKGLYDFKNKFDPKWEPVYICVTPKNTFLSLLDMFYKTGYFKLSSNVLVTNIRAFCSP